MYTDDVCAVPCTCDIRKFDAMRTSKDTSKAKKAKKNHKRERPAFCTGVFKMKICLFRVA